MAAESVGPPVCPDQPGFSAQPDPVDPQRPEPAQSSASKVLALLEALAKIEASTFGVTEVAAAIAVPKSTAHRLLKTLEEHGFVARAGSRYRIGGRLAELGDATRSPRPGPARHIGSAGSPPLRRGRGHRSAIDATIIDDPADTADEGVGLHECNH